LLYENFIKSFFPIDSFGDGAILKIFSSRNGKSYATTSKKNIFQRIARD